RGGGPGVVRLPDGPHCQSAAASPAGSKNASSAQVTAQQCQLSSGGRGGGGGRRSQGGGGGQSAGKSGGCALGSLRGASLGEHVSEVPQRFCRVLYEIGPSAPKPASDLQPAQVPSGQRAGDGAARPAFPGDAGARPQQHRRPGAGRAGGGGARPAPAADRFAAGQPVRRGGRRGAA
ncbi:unnamed protein product, partial [Heterosigma akashiwo]